MGQQQRKIKRNAMKQAWAEVKLGLKSAEKKAARGPLNRKFKGIKK